jgi:hypothetical protein
MGGGMMTNSSKQPDVKGYFKSVDLFNHTMHIIIYPEDGLRSAAKLQELEEGTPLEIFIKSDQE